MSSVRDRKKGVKKAREPRLRQINRRRVVRLCLRALNPDADDCKIVDGNVVFIETVIATGSDDALDLYVKKSDVWTNAGRKGLIGMPNVSMTNNPDGKSFELRVAFPLP